MIRSLLVLLALPYLAGCHDLLQARTGALVVPYGGHDAEGGADQIYFQIAGMEGFRNGLHALVLPVDWAYRTRVEKRPGVFELATPLEPTWVRGDAIDPAPVSYSPGPWSVGFEGESVLYVNVAWAAHGTYSQRVHREGRGEGTPSERLARGENAYLLELVDTEEHLAFALFGAVAPDGAWMRLCEVEFREDRSGLEKFAYGVGYLPARLFDAVGYLTFSELGIVAGIVLLLA